MAEDVAELAGIQTTKRHSKMLTAFAPGTVFGFFCFMMVLQLIWVLTLVPETKGRPLEAIEHDLGMAS